MSYRSVLEDSTLRNTIYPFKNNDPVKKKEPVKKNKKMIIN